MLESIGAGLITHFLLNHAKERLPPQVQRFLPGLVESDSVALTEADKVAAEAVQATLDKFPELETVRIWLEPEASLRRGVLRPLFDNIFLGAPIPRKELTRSLMSCATRNESSRGNYLHNTPATNIVDFLIDDMRERLRVNNKTNTLVIQQTLDDVIKRIRAIDRLTKKIYQHTVVDGVGLGTETIEFCDDYLGTIARRAKSLQISGVDLLGTPATIKHELRASYVELGLQPVGDRITYSEARTEVERARAVTSIEALTTLRKMVIRGPAGSGKTTFLHWIVTNASPLSELVSPGRPSTLSEERRFFPIYIPLRRLETSGVTDIDIDSVFLTTLANSALERRVDPRLFKRLHSAGVPLLFLLDGVDEVCEANRDRVWQIVEGIEHDFPTARILITSRNLPAIHLATGSIKDSIFYSREAYRDARAQWRPSKEFFEFLVSPLSNLQISELVTAWFEGIDERYVSAREKDETRSFVTDLQQEIFSEKHAESLELARTPLLCALICLVYYLQDGRLPADRQQLYDYATDLLLVRRDEAREVASPVIYQTFDLRGRRSLLEYVALQMQHGGEESKDQTIEASKHAVVAMMGHWLRENDYEEFEATEMLNFLVERSSLVREPALNRIDFVHRSFMEYLAAQEIARTGKSFEIRNKIEDDQWLSTLQFCMRTQKYGLIFAVQLIQVLMEYVATTYGGAGVRKTAKRRELYCRVASLLSWDSDYPLDYHHVISGLVDQILPPRDTSEIRDCLGIPYTFLRKRLDFESVNSSNWITIRAAAVLLSEHEDVRSAKLLATGYQGFEDNRAIEAINRSGKVAISDHTALLNGVRAKSYHGKKIFLDESSLRKLQFRRQLLALSRKHDLLIGVRFPFKEGEFVGWDALHMAVDVTIQYANSDDWENLASSVKKRRFDRCRDLELEGCVGFDFSRLAFLFPKARAIVIDSCRQFSTAGLEALQSLEVVEFRRVANAIEVHGDYCPQNLAEISLRSCAELTLYGELPSRVRVTRGVVA